MNALLIFLLLASFSFAMSSSNFILDVNLNSGGGSASSANFVLDADIGSPAVGSSSSSNFLLSLTSLQAQAAPSGEPAPPAPEAPSVPPASAITDSLGIASPDLNVTSLNSSSAYTVSLKVSGQWAASRTLRFSSGVMSIVFNAQVSPVSQGRTVTVQVI